MANLLSKRPIQSYYQISFENKWKSQNCTKDLNMYLLIITDMTIVHLAFHQASFEKRYYLTFYIIREITNNI